MCAARLEELVVYQLADELRRAVYELSARPHVIRDLRFCSQIRDAASSPCRNCAEGFGRYRHREFAHYLTIARGSTFELADLLRDGAQRHHWTLAEAQHALTLCFRLIAAQTKFIRWLRSTEE